MTDKQQQIIDLLSAEISNALSNSDHYYTSHDSDRDKIESYHKGFLDRVSRLREYREKLENEFTTTMYDPN